MSPVSSVFMCTPALFPVVTSFSVLVRPGGIRRQRHPSVELRHSATWTLHWLTPRSLRAPASFTLVPRPSTHFTTRREVRDNIRVQHLCKHHASRCLLRAGGEAAAHTLLPGGPSFSGAITLLIERWVYSLLPMYRRSNLLNAAWRAASEVPHRCPYRTSPALRSAATTELRPTRRSAGAAGRRAVQQPACSSSASSSSPSDDAAPAALPMQRRAALALGIAPSLLPRG